MPKTHHQIVNLRDAGPPGSYADQASYQRALEERREAYDAMRERGLAFVVAPRCRIRIPSTGEVLEPGAEVDPHIFDGLTVADFSDDATRARLEREVQHGHRPPLEKLPGWRHVERMVDAGTVLDGREGLDGGAYLEPEPEPPDEAA